LEKEVELAEFVVLTVALFAHIAYLSVEDALEKEQAN